MSKHHFAERAHALVNEMREAGLADREIASLLTSRLMRRRRVPLRSENYLGAHVGRDTVTTFSKEAKRRNMPLSRLVSRTLQCVASDQIFDAVLDTEEET